MAIAVVLWLVTFAASTVVGIPLLIHEGLSMGELRKLARAETEAEESGEHVPMVGVNRLELGRAIETDVIQEKLLGEMPVLCL